MKTSKPDIIVLLTVLSQETTKYLSKSIKNNVISGFIASKLKPNEQSDELVFSKMKKKNKNITLNSYSSSKYKLRKRVEFALSKIELKNSTFLQKKLFLQHLSKVKQTHCYFEYAKYFIKEVKDIPNKGVEAYQFLEDTYRDIYFHPDYDAFAEDICFFDQIEMYTALSYKLKECRNQVERLNLVLNYKRIAIHDISLMDIEKDSIFDIPVFHVYKGVLQLQLLCINIKNNKDDKIGYPYLQNFAQLIAQQKHHISTIDLLLICSNFIRIINFAYERFDYEGRSLSESKTYLKLMFSTYRLLHQAELLIFKNRVSPRVFLTVSIVSNAVGACEWYKIFSITHAPYIYDKQKYVAVQLAEAFHYFYKGDYEKAEELMSMLDYMGMTPFFKINHRMLELYCIYGSFADNKIDYDTLEHRTKAARHFFDRGIPTIAKQIAFHQTVHFIQKIAKVRDDLSFSELQKQKIKLDILNTKPLLSKSWILTQLDDVPIK